jgi:hypothetical protein
VRQITMLPNPAAVTTEKAGGNAAVSCTLSVEMNRLRRFHSQSCVERLELREVE